MRIRDINRANRKQKIPRRIKWDYAPTERQIQAHEADKRYKLYGGAMGGGKTVWLCAEAINLMVQYPGNRGYLCRHYLQDVKRSTLITFEKIVPHGLIKRHLMDDRTIELWNDSILVYGGLGSQEDLERIKSTEFGFFCIDEATETHEQMFQLLASRLRWTLRNGKRPPYYGLLASNPEPGWVKKRFIDDIKKHRDHVFIPALPKDNPHLPHDYDSGLRQMFPEEAAKRYLDGSWDIFEGQIYVEFDRNTHVYHHDLFADEDAKYFDRFRVIDYGLRNPTCCLWVAVDYDGDLWFYDEHYAADMLIEDHAKEIDRKSKGDNITTICDPTMFSNTMQKYRQPWSPAKEFQEFGISCIRAHGTGDRKITELTGINVVKQRFKHNSIHIHERCVNTIEEIIGYQWKKLKITDLDKNNPEQAVDKANHAVDCIRYACCWKPTKSSKPKKPLDKRSIHYAILEHKKQLRQPFFAGWNDYEHHRQ